MSSSWLKVVLAWLTRRRLRKSTTRPTGPRRRASFPTYDRSQTTSARNSANPPTTNTAYFTVRGSNGYPYQQAPNGQGWPNDARVSVSASAYPHHYAPHAANNDPYLRTSQVPAGYVAVVQPQQRGSIQHSQQPQYFYVPAQGMAQMQNSQPISFPQKQQLYVPPQHQPTAQNTRPPAPPPPQRHARTSRANSAPTLTQPFNPSPKRVADAYARYKAFWTGASSPRSVTFTNIPWPMVEPPLHPTSLNVNAVRSFLLSPHHSQGVKARERIEAAQRGWDPKTFMAHFGPRMKREEMDKIERTLHFLQGTLRILHNEVEAAEHLDPGSPAPTIQSP